MDLSDIVKRNQVFTRANPGTGLNLTPEQRREYSIMQFEDWQRNYGKYLESKPNPVLDLRQYVAKIYCADDSPLPELFEKRYQTTRLRS